MIRLNIDVPVGFKATGEYRMPESFEYFLFNGKAVRSGMAGGFHERIILVPVKVRQAARKERA